MPSLLDLSGRRFGRLSIVSFARNAKNEPAWIVRCDCGTVRTVAAGSLANGNTRSCGCLQRDQTSATHRVHGASYTKEYKAWVAMKARCANPKTKQPGNCRWATKKEQQRNRRTNHLLEFNGTSLTVTEWAERIGIERGIIYGRLGTGWSVEEALTTPLMQHASRRKPIL